MKGARLIQADSSRKWHWNNGPLVKLVWTDPPFGTNKKQSQGDHSYQDWTPKTAARKTVQAVCRIPLTADGVVAICADYRIIHQVVVKMEREGFFFQGEIIWTFGLGRPRTNWWPVRHNTIATFTRTAELPAFDASAIPAEIRKAPKPGYPDTKPAGSVWDYTMSNTDPERVGYPNQKPLSIIEPFVLAHTLPGDIVADPFCGSGSTGIAALKNDRRFLGQDLNPEAIKKTKERIMALD